MTEEEARFGTALEPPVLGHRLSHAYRGVGWTAREIGTHAKRHLPELAKGTLRKQRDTLGQALPGDLSPRHRFVLQHIESPIRFLATELAALERYLIDAMAP